LGDALWAAIDHDHENLDEFLVTWRQELRQHLQTDSKRYIGRRHTRLAEVLPDTFPELDVVHLYMYPATTSGYHDILPHIAPPRSPDLARLSAFCAERFSWGSQTEVVERLRTVFLEASVMRSLLVHAVRLVQPSGVGHLKVSTLIITQEAHY
jgi:holliday junction resolvase YEN1